MQVLLVDDDPAMLRSVDRMLRGAGHGVVTASNVNHARVRMRTGVFGAVLSDFDLGAGKTGLDVLRDARDLQPHARRVLMSGAMPVDALAARDEGLAHALLDKPFTAAALLAALRSGG